MFGRRASIIGFDPHALALGVTVGSVTAGAAHPALSNTFALAADLARSTLLDSSR
jgi:hypothetical protein